MNSEVDSAFQMISFVISAARRITDTKRSKEESKSQWITDTKRSVNLSG